MEILFWRHMTPAQKKKGTCTIYTRITIYGRRADLGSTGIKTFAESWNQDRQRVDDSDPHSTFKNEQIDYCRTRILGIYNELLRNKVTITADRVKELHVQTAEAMTFAAAFGVFLKEYRADASKQYSSFKTLDNVRRLFGRFLAEQRKRAILLEDVTPALMEKYAAYMKASRYEDSYTVKSSRVVKQIVSWSYKNKLIDFDPLEHYSVKHEKKKKPVYINTTQLTFWAHYEFSNSCCQRAADLFVLYCRTGFHYVDLMQVIAEPERYIREGKDEAVWIYKLRQKTDVEAKIPIHHFADLIDPILKKYGGWANLPTMPNQKINDYLKLCVAEINRDLPPSYRIYERLSVKHGRNTFANHILNELNMNKERLITMLGRLSSTDLDVYVRPDEVGVINAFKEIHRINAA